MSSQYSGFCTGPGKESSKNRNDIAGQSIDIEWHVCPGTSVQILHKLQVFMSETGHVPESFPDRIIFVSMFNCITNWKSPKVQTICLGTRERSGLLCSKIQTSLSGLPWSRIGKRLGNISEESTTLTNLLTVNGTNSLTR